MPSALVQQTADFQYHPTLYMALETVCKTISPDSYLEVGSREGTSLRTVVESSPRLGNVVVCDTWEQGHGGSGRGTHFHIASLLDDLGYKGKRTFLSGDSLMLLPTLHDSFDLVLIDGNHTDRYAEADARQGWRLLRPGGILLFDDITHPAHTLQPVYERLFEEFGAQQFSGIAGDVGVMRKYQMTRTAR